MSRYASNTYAALPQGLSEVAAEAVSHYHTKDQSHTLPTLNVDTKVRAVFQCARCFKIIGSSYNCVLDEFQLDSTQTNTAQETIKLLRASGVRLGKLKKQFYPAECANCGITLGPGYPKGGTYIILDPASLNTYTLSQYSGQCSVNGYRPTQLSSILSQ